MSPLTATPSTVARVVQVCRHCGETIAVSEAAGAWVHQATGERACGPIEVRG